MTNAFRAKQDNVFFAPGIFMFVSFETGWWETYSNRSDHKDTDKIDCNLYNTLVASIRCE